MCPQLTDIGGVPARQVTLRRVDLPGLEYAMLASGPGVGVDNQQYPLYVYSTVVPDDGRGVVALVTFTCFAREATDEPPVFHRLVRSFRLEPN